MKVKINDRRRARIEMLPLIDIVFLLLVFFIYAMMSMAVHRGMSVALPESSTAGSEKNPKISVTVTADGSVYVDKAPISPESLTAVLKEKAAGDGQAGAMLFADRELPYQALYRVLDQIRMAGITRISLQARAEHKP